MSNPNTNTAAGTMPTGSPAPSTGAGRRRSPQIEINRPEPGIEALNTRPDTGLNASECDRARGLIKKKLRRKRDLLPPGAKLPEAEKEATYAEAAEVMSCRLGRLVSSDAMRLAAASAHGSNPRSENKGLGVTAQHHALIRAKAKAMDLPMTEVARNIFDAYFEIVPEA